MNTKNTPQKISFDRQYAIYKKDIDSILLSATEDLEYPHKLLDSVRYSLMSGGKRLRPILFCAMVKALGQSLDDKTDLFAASIECIHTYSLIHDDLPCMDNDTERRGKPTNHVVFGESLAMLAGSTLLNLAYELMLKTATQKNFVYACQVLAAYSGGMGMIGGQVEDIALDENRDESKLVYIYTKKTAALFCACVLCAGYIAGVDTSVLKLVAEFGNSFGFAFQIKDDLDDYINGQAYEKGQEKMTWVSVHGITQSQLDMQKRLQKCKLILNELRADYDISFLKGLLDKCFK